MKKKEKKYYFFMMLSSLCAEISILMFFNYPGIIRNHIGDFLIIVFLYSLLKLVTPLRSFWALIIVLGTAYLIEILQWFNILKLFNITDPVMKIVIGTNFDWIDLLSYTFAALFLIITEQIVHSMFTEK